MVEKLKAIIDKHTGNSNIDVSKYTKVRDFMFIWNLFEGIIFKTDYKRNKKNQPVHSLNISQSIIDDTIGYFRSRYANNPNLFNALNLKSSDKPDLIKKVLNENNADKNDVITAINTIIYRYRCNLFHGIKQVDKLWEQSDNFEAANRYMIACLEAKFDIK